LSRGPAEFLPLTEAGVIAAWGPNGRHAALFEDAFDVLLETPGGGVSLAGKTDSRRRAKGAIEAVAARAAQGLEVSQADVRVAIDQARRGAGGGGAPVGRRGAVAAKTAAQARYLELLNEHELVFALGPAGTGKTFLAVAHGAGLLLSGAVDRLVITRPAVEAGERLGFLPGDLLEKVDPYMAPIFEALTEIMGAEGLKRRRDKGEIEVAPIAFMRGRTLSHAFVIVDEAQNASRLQMKMVLTRMGDGARMAVTGDPTQVDLPNIGDSGLIHAARILDGVNGVGMMRFEAEDVVRHPLVERIVRAYDADAASRAR
jgi:phosphate starvation-inducible PhoH-like protein